MKKKHYKLDITISNLESGYSAMAKDRKREEEAILWSEITFIDSMDEMKRIFSQR
jgi:hypothetical protein